MKQLSNLDSAFLFLESSKTPMHIGALHIFESPDKKNASFEIFKERVEERIHLAPVLTQKLMSIPFDLDAPYLVDDPDFSLSLHLNHVGLPAPSDRTALNNLVGEIIRKPMDRSKSLWELTFIDNLDGLGLSGKNHFAIVSKIHHAIVDGMGGEELLSKLLDFSPDSNHRIKVTPPAPQTPPSGFKLFMKSYGAALRSPTKMAQIIAKASTASAKILAQKTAGDLKKLVSFKLAPATLFERDLSDDRVFGTMELPLHQLKDCRKLSPQATLHDVVLGVISSGLREYLVEKNAVPKDNLVSLVPISLRRRKPKQGEENRQGANEIAAMLVDLATAEMSILDRIEMIRQNTVPAKSSNKKTTKISQLTEFLPNIYLSIAAKLYTRWHISNYHNPLFNLVITNVPGPQIPLYMGKAKLLEQYGSAPIFIGMGLSIVVLSYNGTMSIAINSCSSIIPDPQILVNHIEKSFKDLYSLVTPEQQSKPRRRRRARSEAASENNPELQQSNS
ncbi:MAG: wax ester/triacylglycerol synthase family O-acyltransferase [Pseudomonadota bacterium]|nr:wax ester/triacylglycerol synthase family O-acyltransferase [Pseudomonadota bacterium]